MARRWILSAVHVGRFECSTWNMQAGSVSSVLLRNGKVLRAACASGTLCVPSAIPHWETKGLIMNAVCKIGLILPSEVVERVVMKRSYATVLTVEWRGTIVTMQVAEDGRLLHLSGSSYPPIFSTEEPAGSAPVFVTMEVVP